MRQIKVEVVTGDAGKKILGMKKLIEHLKVFGLDECSSPCCPTGQKAADAVLAGLLVEGVDWIEPGDEEDDNSEEDDNFI